MHPCESFGPSKRPQQKLTLCNRDKNSSFCCSSVNHHFLDGAFTGRIKTNQHQNSLNTYWKPLRPHITQRLQITYCNHLRIFSVYILRLLTCGSGRAREAWKNSKFETVTPLAVISFLYWATSLLKHQLQANSPHRIILGTWKRFKEDFHPSFFWIRQVLFRLPNFMDYSLPCTWRPIKLAITPSCACLKNVHKKPCKKNSWKLAWHVHLVCILWGPNQWQRRFQGSCGFRSFTIPAVQWLWWQHI